MNYHFFRPNQYHNIFFLFVLLVMFLLISNTVVINVDTVDSDFFSFWLAGKVVREGLNPYDESVWLAGHEIYSADWISDPIFLYPIYTAVFMMPLSYFNLSISYTLWIWISLILIFFSTVKLLTLFGNQTKFFVVPVFAGLLLFRPILPLLLNGQMSSIFLASLVFSVDLVNNRKPFLGGIILSINFLKPNIGVPIFFLLFFYFLLSKKFSIVCGMLSGLFTLIIIGTVVQPTWILEYLHVLFYKQANTFGYSASIWGLMYLFTGKNKILSITFSSFVCLILFSTYLLWFIKKNNRELFQIINMVIAISTFITPYIWPYDQIILIIPIVYIMTLLARKKTPFLFSSLFFLGIDIIVWCIFGYSLQLQTENLQALLPLALIIILFVTSNFLPISKLYNNASVEYPPHRIR